ncbi:MAG TPA: hypothetical protein VFA30_09855, partial [Gaiellaceae bacterium]|nr:hypothetical protein [Gaiellaceae bacterium]
MLVFAGAAAYASLHRTATATPTSTPSFIRHELGARASSAPHARTVAAGTTASLESNGYTLTNNVGSLTLTQSDGGSNAWTQYRNGAARTTSYGNESVVLGGSRVDAEQYVTVNRHNGSYEWRWRISAGSLTPVLRPDGSVLVSPAHVVDGFGILPVSILDKRGRKVTPHGLTWGVEHHQGSWWLTLSFDDSGLPLPYTIDPATESFRNAQSAGNASATTLVITKPTGLAVNDLMLAQITVRGGSNEFTCAPSATGTWNVIFTTNDSTTLQQVLYWKVATAADVAATNYTFSFDTSGATCPSPAAVRASGGISAFYGVNDASPINASSALVTTSSTTIATTAINNGTTGNFLVSAFGVAYGEAITPASGSERYDVGSTGSTIGNRTDSELSTSVTAGTGSMSRSATIATAADGIGQLLTLALDTVAPTNALSLVGGAGQAYQSGNTVYYNGSAAGSFQLKDTVTETGSGVANVVFPALGGTSTGWTHTTDTETTPVGGPYVSANTFSWNSGTSTSPTEAVAATDNATNAATTTLTFTNDSTAPTGGAISGASSGGSVTLTTTPFTDAGSGIASNTITRSNGLAPTVPGAACPTSGYSGSTVVTSPDSGVTDGLCYVYTLTGTDNVGNTATAVSSPVLVGYPAAVGSTGSTGTPTSLTFSVTVPNKLDEMLVVGVTSELAASNNCQATVTYGGTAMTQITNAVTTSTSYECTSLWYMKAPPVGTANVVATFPSAMDGATAGGVVLWNVAQGAPEAFNSNVQNASPPYASATLTTLTPNDTVVDVYDSGQGVGDLAPAAGQTELWTADGSTTHSGGMSMESVPTPGSTSMTWTQTGPNRSIDIAAAFAPFDQTPPSDTLALTSQSGGSYVNNGTQTIYYRGAALGSFQLQNTENDGVGGSGSVSSGFSALGGTTTGWSHTPQTISTPVGGPYVSTNNYSWTAGTSSSPTLPIVATDAIGNQGTTTYTLVNDSTAPTGGGPVSVPAFSSSLGGITITVTSNFSDGGSGIASNVITRSNGQSPSSPGVCPASGYSGATVVTSPDTVPTDGLCYVYTLTGTDRVGNTASVSSSPILVDTTAPSAPTVTFSGLSAGNAYDNGSGTLFFRPSAGGTFTVNASATDAQSGVASYAFGSLNTNGGSNFGTSQSGNQLNVTFTAATTGPTTARTVSATNNSGLTGGNGTYTITQDTSSPTATTTFPAAAGVYNAAGWNATGQLAGTASDAGSSGVQAVKVSIQDTTVGGSSCWNGTSFTAACPNYVAASGTNSWTYALAASALTDTHNYTATVETIDNVGNTNAAAASVSWTYDSSAPSTASLTSNGVYNGAGWPGAITGTTTDSGTGSHGISAVKVSIQDGAGSCWNGASFA